MSEGEKQKKRKSTGHPFDQLMFGTRQKPVKSEEEEPPSPSPEIPAEQSDMMTLIKSVDQIMGSVNKLKPMAKQLGPLFNIFKTKK